MPQFQPSPKVPLRNAWDVINHALPALVDPRTNELTPANAAAQFFDTVEIRTNATPTITFNVRSLDDPTPSPVMRRLQPTVILQGPVGTARIAPYGEADSETGSFISAGAVVGIALVAGTVGYLAARRHDRRAGLGSYQKRRNRTTSR